jgi:hypothetical protein
MEIERGVRIEYGGESEAGLSSGPRNTEQLPAYTDAEMTEALGDDLSAEIEGLFRRPQVSNKRDAELAGGGLA